MSTIASRRADHPKRARPIPAVGQPSVYDPECCELARGGSTPNVRDAATTRRSERLTICGGGRRSGRSSMTGSGLMPPENRLPAHPGGWRYWTRKILRPKGVTLTPKPGSSASKMTRSFSAGISASTMRLVSLVRGRAEEGIGCQVITGKHLLGNNNFGSDRLCNENACTAMAGATPCIVKQVRDRSSTQFLIRGSWVRVPARSPIISKRYRQLPFERPVSGQPIGSQAFQTSGTRVRPRRMRPPMGGVPHLRPRRFGYI